MEERASVRDQATAYLTRASQCGRAVAIDGGEGWLNAEIEQGKIQWLV
jgi:hypothetical protein